MKGVGGDCTEMPDLLLYFSTAACWLLLSGMAWRASRRVVAGGRTQARSDLRIETVVVPVALVLHGMLLYRRVVVPDGLDLGVANAISMLVWLTVVIYWLASLAFQGLAGILGLVAPGPFAAVLRRPGSGPGHVGTDGV